MIPRPPAQSGFTQSVRSVESRSGGDSDRRSTAPRPSRAHPRALAVPDRVKRVTEIDAGGKVIFGSTIRLLDDDTEQEITYKIVGQDEADIKTGLISYTSPIARALIGKDEGDAVEFKAPDGVKSYEVIEVNYD